MPTCHNLFSLFLQFLQHYFEIYDKNKQELLPAYHPNSVFSISAALNKAIPHRQPDISAYVKNKGVRNLKINSVWNGMLMCELCGAILQNK